MAEKRISADQQFTIVLKPVSHPELGDILIDENLFAIGRTEAPFGSYAADVVADLSRRHARIFSEYGAVYVADVDSKNGTCVNGIDVQQKITRLRDGDEICFGRTLSYRVQLRPRATRSGQAGAKHGAELLSLTLTPERNDLGLQPIVITQFPFLIGKADQAFSRYKDAYPHQVNYLSRRHAHIFLKGGEPFVEDLGSTNGTFVGGIRLDEHAVALKEDDTLAFGGHHFVYTVRLQKQEAESTADSPTVTKLSAGLPGAAQSLADADKTTFVAAADSFLEIFCVDQAQGQDDELNDEAAQAAASTGQEADTRARKRKKFSLLFELAEALGDNGRAGGRRTLRWGLSLLVLAGLSAFFLYRSGAPERELKSLIAGGDYAQAATAASRNLARDPDNAELKALGTEALLKANLPNWLALLKAREFERAAAVLAGMKKLSRYNAEVQPFVAELEWVGELEKFVNQRGGADAPLQGAADAEKLRRVLEQWDEDTQGHQRAFVTIASYVPEFKDAYAEALSHLRKLALIEGGRHGKQDQGP